MVVPRAAGGRGAIGGFALPLAVLLAGLLGASCASPKTAAPATLATPHGPLTPQSIPTDALNLLTKSLTDSCSICAENHRRNAFEEMDQVFRPGAILECAGDREFMRVAGGESELMIAAAQDGEPKLTFRFHTASNHLVGIAETDFTDDALAERVLAAPEGAPFRGRIEIVGYAYGDGSAFLYSPAGNHLQIQCKLLDLTAE